jgi:hypothetical protein
MAYPQYGLARFGWQLREHNDDGCGILRNRVDGITRACRQRQQHHRKQHNAQARQE